MDKNIKNPRLWVWVAAFIFCLAAILVILQVLIMRPQPATTNPFVLPAPASQGAGPVEATITGSQPPNIASNLPATVIDASQPVYPSIAATDNIIPVANQPAALKDVPALTGSQPIADRPVSQGAESVVAVAINAPLTDAQILDNIQRQNQVQQSLEEHNVKRDKLAAQVLRRVEAEESQDTGKQQVIASDHPQDAPPAGIAAKLRSGQLTAH